MNTPQFEWCKSNLPKHPQPVPPIFQPEVAARGIVWAAYHRRREVHVGLSTAIVIWGNKFLPGLGDRYLARTGFGSQQTEEPVPRDRPFNLFEPVHGFHDAHGEFDNRAHSSSWQLWFTTHRRAILASAFGGGALLAAWMVKS